MFIWELEAERVPTVPPPRDSSSRKRNRAGPREAKGVDPESAAEERQTEDSDGGAMRVQALRADQQTISKRSPCRRSGEGNSLRVHTRAASESGSNRSQSTTIPAAATSIVPDSEQSPDGAPTTRQQQQQEPGIFQEKEHAHCVGLKTASPLVLEFDAPDGTCPWSSRVLRLCHQVLRDIHSKQLAE